MMSDKSVHRSHMANGHSAGMQTGQDFGKREKEIRLTKEEEMRAIDAAQSGANAETTYRDKSGRKKNMLNEYMREQAVQEGKKLKIEEAQQEWGRSSVQKEMDLERLQDMANIATGPFARSVTDPKLERERREAIREGDPMYEQYMRQRKAEVGRDRAQFESEEGEGGVRSEVTLPASASSAPPTKRRKPLYNGPNVAPNRFTFATGKRPVLPGYRWDGVDRSNKLEKKVLLKINERGELREDEYKWSVSDM